MSRIIVKNLPKNINEEKLRNLFSSKGRITDLQMKYTPDGKFRQFCFVGYSSVDEAQAAIKFFNNTCVQTSRIKVESCAALGSEEKPQSWSKYAKDSKINAKNEPSETEKDADSNKINKQKKSTKVDEILGKHKDDPEFQEFLKAHDKNRTLWANDAALVETPNADENATNGEILNGHAKVLAKNDQEIEDDEVEEDDNAEDDDDDDEEEEQTSKLAVKPISDIEYMKSLMTTNSKKDTTKKQTDKQTNGNKKTTKSDLELFTIKIQNVPYKVKRQDILKFFKPLKPYSVRCNVRGYCYVGFKTDKEMSKAMLKNKSFIKGKQVFFTDFTEKNKITKAKRGDGNDASAANNSTGNSNAKWKQQEDAIRNEEDISESGCIFFRNLPYTTTEEELQKLFEQFGPVTEVHLPVDNVTRQIKGFGTVTFVMPEHALLAFNKLDGTDFHGRLLHLIPGKSKVQAEEINENDESLTFKQKKELKLKKTAQQAVTWNTLFMGANAVAELISKQFNISKEQLLDTSEGGSSAAVRLALGETQIVIEMKRFLEENGVQLSAFDSPTVKRSKTIILAKNLPAETTIAELTPIFGKFGPIGRIVLPPSGVTALIEYCDPAEARHAFKKLAFSKFKTVPLFLEWAPENAFTTTLSGEPIICKVETETKTETVPDSEMKTEEINENNEKQSDEVLNENVPEDADDEPEPNTTLFLRNLNFKTVQDTVYAHFKHLGTIHTVEIAKRKDPENPRQMNSLGYGFIQFKKSDAAEKALKTMQFTIIDGNQVELKRSDRTLRAPNADAATQRRTIKQTKQTGTKILVRNIPFQAHHKEVRDIFSAFGELRSLRMPKKMTPGTDAHRGFGFVDYISKSDAKNAFEALSASTHLYGRRLVLEWASTTDDDLEEIRKRTATQFNANAMSTNAKRSRKAVFNTDEIIEKLPKDNDDEA